MKSKAPKISEVTLFVYKKSTQALNKFETDTTTTITTTMNTSSGFLYAEKGLR